MASGSVTLSGSTAAITTLSGGRVVLGGAAVTVSDGTFTGTLSGSTGSLTKTGPGTLALAGTGSLSAPTSVHGGILRLDDANALSASSVTSLAGGTLTIASRLAATIGGLSPNAGGLTDVGDGSIRVAAGLGAADLVSAIIAGRSDGSWTGTSGITSSSAAADVARGVSRGVGWLDNGDGSLTFAYAAAGDTNLDRSIDILDVGNFLALGKFGTGVAAGWIEGDFSYDGIVDILDAAQFLATGLFDAGAYGPTGSLAAVAAVPEPASAWLLAAAAMTAAAVARGRWRSSPLTRLPEEVQVFLPAHAHCRVDIASQVENLRLR
jgi:autotransporter-associated beta strand protein